MADQIFFSYSRYDSVFVLKLASDLRNAGLDIWLDQLDIAPGEHWDNEIEKALNNATTLLAIISPKSVASDNAMDEVSFALEEKKRVIPVLLAAIETPFRLRRLQRIDFTGDYDTGFRQLLVALIGEAAVKKAGEASAGEANTIEKDELLWQQSCAANTVSAYQRYLRVTASTTHIEQAWQRIDHLQHAAPVSTSVAPASVPPGLKQSPVPSATQKSKFLLLFGSLIALGVLAWGAFQVFSRKAPAESKVIAPVADSAAKKQDGLVTAPADSPRSPLSPIVQKPEEVAQPKSNEAGEAKKIVKRPATIDAKKPLAESPSRETTATKTTDAIARQPEENQAATENSAVKTSEKKKVTIYSKVIVNLYLSESPDMHEKKKSEQFLKFIVSSDVVYAGKVIISKGTVARGSLTIGSRQTDIRLYDVAGTDGNLIPLQTEKEHGRRDDVASDKNYLASIKPGTTVSL